MRLHVWPVVSALALCAQAEVSANDTLPATAVGSTALDRGEPRVEGRLLVDPQPAADGTLRVGVELRMDPGWHVYWKDPGETGLPTVVRFDVEGGQVGPIAWPAPQRFAETDGALTTFGYEGEVLLAASVERTGKTHLLRAEVELLACEYACIPGSLSLSRDVPAAVAAALRDPRGASELHARFEAAAARVPPSAPATSPGESAGAPEALTATPGGSSGLLRALALALLGGLVLNLMPCVLPVLAIKLFSLAELGANARRERRLHAIAYAAGVLGSMLALALVVVALRAAGTSVGWGFQLQEPRFALAMCALLVVFALNLFGAFEFGTPQHLAEIGAGATGARRSFFEGLLAVALATPCTAPFLGTAVGFAFAGSAAVIIAIFLAVGAGLALPYLLATLYPPFAKLVPRSGPWMLRLRTVLGFALLATAIWLLSVFGRVTGPDGVVAALGFLLVLAFAIWLAGWWRPAGRAWPALSTGVAVVAFALAGVNAVTSSPQPAAGQAPAAHDGWEPFDAARVREVVASGRPALVYFTADWCLTCKYNERFVLADATVQAELERRDVARFRADWTRRDERIRAELARFGRAGVPLAVLWRPESPDQPSVLPELLSVETLLAALREPVAQAGR